MLDWLVRAGLVPAPEAQRFRRTAADTSLDAVAGRARELREWFRAFVSRHAGRPLPPAAVRELGRLNQLLAQDEVYRQLEPVRARRGRQAVAPGPAVQWRAARRWRTPDALLLPIVEAMGDFVCRADLSYVRRCERCTLWFLDVSKGHGRRWCSMALCGNREKAAAHRARAQA